MSRRTSEGYIDQATSGPAEAEGNGDAHQFDDAESSGSSISEESEGLAFEDGVEIPEEQLVNGPLSHGSSYEDEEAEEEGEWDVDDEDWELANGATSGSVPLPARNAPAQPSSSRAASAKPNPLAHVGVAMNPKVAHEKQDKDKSDRATQDQVLDSRTRLVLAGLVNRNIIGKIERCVSTGKEANVYFAQPGVAVKIYRTSILNFRSRSNYIVGEQRFRGEYTSSKNPRKMIRVWAEKELRNLRRLVQGGIRAPKVHDCKENVLVMEFLGQGDE
ncbi:uncharacterized protein I303_105426 [Kwoniella dejecticola CBS 10117]|uniref:non-specific serine/threonine protein kinase n=1 Tax=Kwoniella dejecticola CBS 10117 TaxID=1296121 RepID=A0AAJ8MIS6_9TREE